MDLNRVLVDCIDEPGLIYRITAVLFQHGCNIVRNQEFVDTAAGHFFMRTEFSGGSSVPEIAAELAKALPAGAGVRVAPAADRRIVVLATKEPYCLGELLLLHSFRELGASVVAVVANRPALAELANRFGVPFHCISHEGLSTREHEARIAETLGEHKPDYLVLAKYMRILSPEFLTLYPQRIINIHHSFLPAFVGALPYRQAFERGVKLIGATAHYVTESLDEGPIIAQSVIPVDHSYSPARMAQAGRDIEKLVLARAIKLVCEDRVFLHGNRTVVFE
jgi:formyltetrahydrofolate deformylase